MDIQVFRNMVWDHYTRHSRKLPWRADTDSYAITVSELMLQQTQVSRVIPKYNEFMQLYPDWQALTEAKQADVLRAWQGLGYNRRARYLHQIAQFVTNNWAGNIPTDPKELSTLPGIGVNTAGAIIAYTYNLPVVFIETNIRSVFLHHFFNNKDNIHDKKILPLVEAALDTDNPREWYWALMDYGTHIKALYKNPSRRSSHYSKQSKFEGSRRQLRARVLKLVLSSSPLSAKQLSEQFSDDRLPAVLKELVQEGLIGLNRGRYSC